jgi:thiol:disulfide interchange protein/DsbC/DsbD-like thiol-disulfide interchange protein
MRMRSLLRGLLGLLLLALPAAAEAPPVPADLVRAKLVAEHAAVAPGSVLWVALDLAMKPGWHTYWRNPGDAGVATALEWHLPPGFSAGAIRWPVPERIVAAGIASYGYTGKADLLVPIRVPADALPGTTAALTAHASWLVCAEICLPGGADLSLGLPVAASPGPPDPAAVGLFAAARSRLPQPASFETRFAAERRDFRLFVPAAAIAGLEAPKVSFFPYDGSLIEQAADPEIEHRPGGLDIVLPIAKGAKAPATLDGILAFAGKGGEQRAFAIGANPGLPARPPGLPWFEALLLAFAGGVILNAMPCVFPILSLKLLGLAQQARMPRRERLGHGAAYSAGVVASFAALGGVLLALRAGGEAIGWGFQLQSPVFVALLAYLLMAMGLSLSGLASFGERLAAAAGGRLAGGHAGNFLVGVLATFVATPCTAPLMGAAMGFALFAPKPLAIGIFAAAGLGLAAPYLLATAVPGWPRLLPRPGRWMEIVKQVLAFPLYGSVAWLFWVLVQETGPVEAFAALAGLVLVIFAVWIYGRSRPAPAFGRRLGAALALGGTAAAILLAAELTPTTGAAALATAAPRHGLAYQPFTPARLAALRAEHKPIFVNLTAAWCVTCLVNERVALANPAVAKAFAQHGIVALEGDWTRQDPAITEFLERFGRSGVPLYLLYGKAGEPQVLPQILTPATVLDALARI